MNRWCRWAVWLGLTFGWAGLAGAQTGPVVCVVCGEGTEAGVAVILGTEAYPVHTYGCKPLWERAQERGMLDGLEKPIPPQHPVFDAPELRADLSSEPVGLVGNPFVWGCFLLGACTLSGTMAMIFGILTGRSRLAAFALGFVVPAVGMVLVPVLPLRKTGSA